MLFWIHSSFWKRLTNVREKYKSLLRWHMPCDVWHFVWRWYCVLKTFWEFLISFWLKTRRVASKSLVCVCLVSCAKAKLIGIQIRFGAVFNVNYSNLCDFNHRSCLSIVSLLGLHGAYDQFFVTVAVFMQAHN